MKKEKEPVTIEKIRQTHAARREEIRARLAEFEAVWQSGTDERLWEEMVFCFFTGGCSARMGMRSIEAVRPFLQNGDYVELSGALSGVHRYPFARAGYIVASRDFLRQYCGLKLRDKLASFTDDLERRDWLVREKRIKGLGYKEASHFLRNIGLKGYAILDKHVLRSLAELKIIDDPKPPNTRSKYLTVEQQLKNFACRLEIDFEEMDLVLWSLKTGEILK
ncbi:MAG TPA: N-glycosylase/DNA lyase [Pyrinomonadaceae bacterium]